eukprot:CAMPEP_0198309626 /NCGR_PEP_ID=MMETSP1450-20131203/1953_1 /TAXON_ID=753684 ORGANISM="Madagascaria erythrocladiodes, Strain CCMP3234" /NCGR_SAMPLE_ID=MMETSP1450 /ASSEMBLY_ACC=CAM_ASM_001115 /LENGTH=63 /DNA_ID=CAMNT_0044012393 /DNA_START=195 /DNA_END=386 /DNA_ORIENTATION=+
MSSWRPSPDGHATPMSGTSSGIKTSDGYESRGSGFGTTSMLPTLTWSPENEISGAMFLFPSGK